MGIPHYFIHPGDILWSEDTWCLLYESPARANATFTISDLWRKEQAKEAANMSTWWQPEVQRWKTRKAKERHFESLPRPGLIPPGRSMLVLESSSSLQAQHRSSSRWMSRAWGPDGSRTACALAHTS